MYQYQRQTNGAEFYQWRTLVQAAIQKQNPRRQAKHRELSQVYYICQQWSFIATGHRSHSFPLNAASSGMCECVRRSSAISLPTVRQIISSCTWRGAMQLHHILTKLQTPYPLSCVLSSALTGSASLKRSGEVDIANT